MIRRRRSFLFSKKEEGIPDESPYPFHYVIWSFFLITCLPSESFSRQFSTTRLKCAHR
jgi:hypothetical protein